SGRGRPSNTWVSEDTKTYQEFLVVRNAMRRLFRHSEVAQMKFPDYVAHKEAVMEAKQKELAIKLKTKEEEKGANYPYVKPIDVGVSPKGPQANRGPVLDEPTIWCPAWRNGKDEIAPWPSQAEMKWEGDDRAKTGVGRYLPLPREVGAPGIHWNQLAVLEQYPLDKVREIPTMEDIYLPVDEIDDSVKYDLVTKELEDAVDA
ncbi:uncharacterized protein BDR25DRAFT_195931, partial [Lindgomyces ingoldianus]